MINSNKSWISYNEGISTAHLGTKNIFEGTPFANMKDKFVASSVTQEDESVINPKFFQKPEMKGETKKGGILSALSHMKFTKYLTSALAGLTLFAATSMVYLPEAYAQEMVNEPPAATMTLEKSELREARELGISVETATKIKKNPALEATLRTLPQKVIKQFKNYSPAQKAVLYKDITGKTRIGLISINNREAYVKGTVMGMDVFSRMGDKIDQHVRDGEITAQEGEQIKENIPAIKELSPAQRDAIATIIIWECAPK